MPSGYSEKLDDTITPCLITLNGLFAVEQAPIPSWHHPFPKIHAFSGMVCPMPDQLKSALNLRNEPYISSIWKAFSLLW